jgi:LPS export ABC transporter protein LptC
MAIRAAAIWTACALIAPLCGCARHAEPVPSPSPPPARSTLPPYRFHGHGTAQHPVAVKDLAHGHAVYVLTATDVYYSTSSSQGRFENNTIRFYKGSDVRLTVTAPTADVNRVNYDFVLRDGVTAKSATGVTLSSDTMAYNGNTQLLTATGHVRAVDAQGDVITGDKAVADLDLQQIHVSDHVGISKP